MLAENSLALIDEARAQMIGLRDEVRTLLGVRPFTAQDVISLVELWLSMTTTKCVDARSAQWWRWLGDALSCAARIADSSSDADRLAFRRFLSTKRVLVAVDRQTPQQFRIVAIDDGVCFCDFDALDAKRKPTTKSMTNLSNCLLELDHATCIDLTLFQHASSIAVAGTVRNLFVDIGVVQLSSIAVAERVLLPALANRLIDDEKRFMLTNLLAIAMHEFRYFIRFGFKMYKKIKIFKKISFLKK